MMIRSLFPVSLLVCSCFLWNCGDKKQVDNDYAFTKADSLTDVYLALQDSVLKSWNVLISDDNHKIKAMHNLLHELMVSNPDERERYTDYEERLDQLVRMRYTQKSMANAHVIKEYDFASDSLIQELLRMAQSKREFSYNTTLQKLVNDIRSAELRSTKYRLNYDNVVLTFNRFLEKNKEHLSEVDQSLVLDKKPLFQMVSEDEMPNQ